MGENISKRTIFKKNFLKNISCACTLECASWSADTKNEIENLLCTNGFSHIDTGVLPLAQAKKDTISIMVSSKMMVIATDIKDYISFEHFLDTLMLASKLLDTMHCKVIKGLFFQKMNQYNIHVRNNEQKVSEDELYKLLFSDVMLDNLPIRIKKEKDGEILFAQTAFKEEGTDQASVSLIVGAALTKRIKVDEWIQRMQELNKALYAIWMEATSETIRNVMKQEQEKD